MMKFRFLYIALFFSLIVNAQIKKKDTLNTEVINVVKPFNPTVSDAFKIRRNPNLEIDKPTKPKKFEYHIISIPVASTFIPAQGSYVRMKSNKFKTIYNNFISGGFGNYNTPSISAFIHKNITKNNDIGAFFNLLSSDGGIKKVLLNNAFSDVNFDAYYKQSQNQFDWQINSGVRFQKYNWYGLSPFVTPTAGLLSNINAKQNYNNFYAGGSMAYYDAVFQGGTFEYNFISDNYKTSENHVFLSPEFSFPLSSEFLTTQISFDYLDGKFDRGYLDLNPISYQFLNLGIHPNLEVKRQNLSFNLGVKLYYSSVSKNQQKSKFYAYPNITASYKINENGFTAFAGITGNLHQNTYNDFINTNNFVSPTLIIKPTDEQYRGYIGVKGLESGISYSFKASYKSENNMALFILNPAKDVNIINKAYTFGNSFNVIYDDVKTFIFEAQTQITISNNIDFGGNLVLNNYSLSTQKEAWNLPKIKAYLFAKYNYKKWFAKTQIFVVGQRKGQLSHLFTTSTITTPQIINNAAYFDLNINGGYHFSDRLSAFAKFNNILGDNYQQFTNYQVQGFQALAGITYKFN